MQSAAIRLGLAGILLELGVDVLAEAAVVEPALFGVERAPQEATVERLAEHIQPEVLVAEAHPGVGDTRRRQAGGGEHLVADPLAQPAVVLGAVVQVEAAQAVEAVLAVELGQVHGETRPLVEFAEAAGGALQLDADAREAHAVELQIGFGVGARFLPQALPGGIGQQDLHLHDRVAAKNAAAGSGCWAAFGRPSGRQRGWWRAQPAAAGCCAAANGVRVVACRDGSGAGQRPRQDSVSGALRGALVASRTGASFGRCGPLCSSP